MRTSCKRRRWSLLWRSSKKNIKFLFLNAQRSTQFGTMLCMPRLYIKLVKTILNIVQSFNITECAYILNFKKIKGVSPDTPLTNIRPPLTSLHLSHCLHHMIYGSLKTPKTFSHRNLHLLELIVHLAEECDLYIFNELLIASHIFLFFWKIEKQR